MSWTFFIDGYSTIAIFSLSALLLFGTMSSSSKKTVNSAIKAVKLNDLMLPHIQDEYCFVKICDIKPYAKVRPISQEGIENLTNMVIESGYNVQSVLMLRAPLSRSHVHFDLSDKLAQIAGIWAPPKASAEEEKKHADDDFGYFYGTIDGAHRHEVLEQLAARADQPTFGPDFLVPARVFTGKIPESLVIAIAARKNMPERNVNVRMRFMYIVGESHPEALETR